MPEARIIYPQFDEVLACTAGNQAGVVRLSDFSDNLLLAPGDLVSVSDTGIVTGIVSLADGWLVEVHFHFWAKADQLDALVMSWAADGIPLQHGLQGFSMDTNSGAFTALLLADRDWIDGNVQNNELVEFWHVRREAGMPVIFDPRAAVLEW